jgi:hypothetical protein
MILKSKLVEEKGGFGQKIYDYIYGRMEIRNIKDNISDSSNQSNRDNGEDSNANVEHYYCYNNKRKY